MPGQEVVFGFGAPSDISEAPGLLRMAQQADRDGLLGVLGQRRRVRVGGEGDLLERRGEDRGLQRLAGVRGELVVGGRGGPGRVGLDVVQRVQVRLQQVRDDRRVRGEE